MPDIDDGIGHRFPLQIGDGAVQPQGFRVLTAVIHAGIALAERRVRHIQRPFDGARGADVIPRRRLFFVGAHIEVVLQP
ncbi:hypothetical protein D3C81_1434600 [compost metagenome]